MICQPTRLLMVGSVLGRLVLTMPNLPGKGGDVFASVNSLQAGGGFVVLASAERLGLPVALCGKVGTGPFGTLTRHELENHHVKVLLPPVNGDQGFSICMLESDGDRTFVTCPGVESSLTPEDLAAITARPDDAVVIDGFDLVEAGTGDAIAAWCGPNGGLGQAMLVLDPGPLVTDIADGVLDVMLGRADVLVVDHQQLRLLTGADCGDDPTCGAAPLLDSMPPGAVIVVRRQEGAWLVRRDVEPRFFPAVAGHHADSAPADDAFTGVFVAELAQCADVETATWHATVAASMSPPFDPATRPGRAVIGPTREELTAALERDAGAL